MIVGVCLVGIDDVEGFEFYWWCGLCGIRWLLLSRVISRLCFVVFSGLFSMNLCLLYSSCVRLVLVGWVWLFVNSV